MSNNTPINKNKFDESTIKTDINTKVLIDNKQLKIVEVDDDGFGNKNIVRTAHHDMKHN